MALNQNGMLVYQNAPQAFLMLACDTWDVMLIGLSHFLRTKKDFMYSKVLSH
jgi:hypothetical protein